MGHFCDAQFCGSASGLRGPTRPPLGLVGFERFVSPVGWSFWVPTVTMDSIGPAASWLLAGTASAIAGVAESARLLQIDLVELV